MLPRKQCALLFEPLCYLNLSKLMSCIFFSQMKCVEKNLQPFAFRLISEDTWHEKYLFSFFMTST